jgi:hypothetical protein
MHENRETSLASAQAGRSGKANNHKPDTYAREESDCAVVPMKQPNKEAIVSAEVVEEKAQTEENDAEPSGSLSTAESGHPPNDEHPFPFRRSPLWEIAIETGKSGGHKESTGRVGEPSGKLSR